MEGLETMDRECAALGGLFQQVVNDMKTGVPHYEDFISKAGKLHTQVKNTILALGSFLDTFQKIADAATNTKGATREIGACLTRIVIRHKAMEARMKTLSSALLDCMVLPLQEKMEDWKKVANTLDKEHSKEYKKLRQELKKKVDNHARVTKKQKKSSKGAMERDPKVEQSVAEVSKQLRTLHDVEKTAVRKVLVEERSRYCTFVACLKPVLGEETAMMVELQQLEEVMGKLDKHTEDPFKLPEASEQVVSDVRMSEGGVVFQTPPSSPSSLGSRKSSMCSISSASSSGGSTNSPSHQPHQHRHGRQPQAGVGAAMGPMRLSSISSQDSGFTSQDTLFLRPGSPHRAKTPDGSDQDLSTSGGSTPGSGWTGSLVPGMPGHAPLTDRPHTISSAYEKERQRPGLQPYTFNPPIDRTIQEEEEKPPVVKRGSGGGGSEEQLTNNKPPIPKRSFSLERPSLPGKTQAAILARQRMAQGNNLPNFMCDQPDMVVPQPVYMNMSDLANLAAARANEQQAQAAEDTADLKTPTAEDLAGIGSGSGTSESGSSLGESSGYGSQNTVRLEEAASADGHYAVPEPAPLLDASKYRSSLRGRGTLIKGRDKGAADSRPSLQRPFSFTQGYIPEGEFSNALGAQLGVGMNASRGTILRRSSSQASKPAPPTRRTSSISSQGSRASLEENPGEYIIEKQQTGVNKISERQVSWADCEQPGSNSTTPRGSMEFLPPPPPHLLHSDGEEEVEEDGKVISKRGMSVAESIKALQNRQAPPHPSPGTLRRVHSVAGSSPHHTDRPQANSDAWSDRNKIRARLEASLNSPGRPRPASPAHALHDQIYAPVAALQQKIQQQQQARLMHQQGDPAMVQHPPGPVVQHQAQPNHQPQPSHQPQPNHQSPEGEQYGFGMQFHLQSNNYYTGPQQKQPQYSQQEQQQPVYNQQQPQYAPQQQQQPQYTQQLQPIYNQQYPQQQPRPQNYNQQQHNLPPPPSSFHQYSDQVMEQMDPTLATRPQPPDLRNGHGMSNGGPHAPRGSSSAQYDQQTALRVRRWIETRTQPDVAKCRPILNAEIQQGFCLRKTSSNNDRSGPRFY